MTGLMKLPKDMSVWGCHHDGRTLYEIHIQMKASEEVQILGDPEMKWRTDRYKLAVPFDYGGKKYYFIADEISNKAGHLGRDWTAAFMGSYVGSHKDRAAAHSKAERIKEKITGVWNGYIPEVPEPPQRGKPTLRVIRGGRQ